MIKQAWSKSAEAGPGGPPGGRWSARVLLGEPIARPSIRRTSDRVATARDDGQVNRRTVYALVMVLTIGILFAGSGVASAEPAAQSQNRASPSDCVWFWWIDRWVCRDREQQAHDDRLEDEDGQPEPEGSHSPATSSARATARPGHSGSQLDSDLLSGAVLFLGAITKRDLDS
jgi:hypothetical protein